MNWQLNERASKLIENLAERAETLRIVPHEVPGSSAKVFDFGIKTPGGLAAGRLLAEVCMSGLAEISTAPGELSGGGWSYVQVATDHPVAACLLSQYAGWQLAVGKFFAMGSGPMRAAAGREELFEKLAYRETPQTTVGVLEGRKLPTPELLSLISEKTGISQEGITLLVAPTASIAGNFQVVSRVVETALHKLFESGFDVQRLRSAWGSAPLSPVAQDDLTGIGRTNDAILYGGRVHLWVQGDDESLQEIGPKIPAISSACYGQPFLKIFEAAGRDFYKIDPHLFSPVEITFHNLDTGRVHRFGQIAPEILRESFGL